ncbi:hypothetical protein C2845_PM02G38500 [Panicum miliaceum]|uniref:Coiled-coil domain-containing protein n=1 Tax=Panicum miliaceum TaxID=4540 RepID=A0A3L6S445_PANMI|nr:hypothetical protein C2845_PM02G38500 [Panicum miliaceum]
MTRGSNRLARGILRLKRQKNPEGASQLPPRSTARRRGGLRNAEEDGCQHQGGAGPRAARAQEEAYWQAAEGPKSRSARRREEDAEKRAEAAARRAENRRLAELEQQQLAAAVRRPDRKAALVGGPAVPKVTEAELARRREDERLRLQREAEAAKKRQARTADEEEYGRVVLVANTNRDDSVIEARSVEDAIAKMTIAAEPAFAPDRHPERRLKVSYKAFEEAELAKLKEEKPGLTLHQYKDMIWKLWKKSPDNPLNQVQA